MRRPGNAAARMAVAAALLMFVGCGTTSVADFEDQLWDEIKKETPAAAKPDCPDDAKVEDGQSFTCVFQQVQVETPDPTDPFGDSRNRPTEPGEIPDPEPGVDRVERKVDVKVEGDDFRWELKE